MLQFMSKEKTTLWVRCGKILKHDLREALGFRHGYQWKALMDNMERESEVFRVKFAEYKNKHSVTVNLARDILTYVDEDYKDYFKIEYDGIK